MLEFNMPKNRSSKIKVIGVGGGGTNAVNHMHRLGIKDVDLVVANTDMQSLDASPVLVKIQLGENLTEGLGAGTNPERGKAAAEESLSNINELLSVNTKMLFITCGMGGGTGTGAAPVIAEAARAMGILTVGIATTPFDFEGPKTKRRALEGLEELKKHVDSTIVISNETLREVYGNMDIDNAYSKADDILAIAAKSIADCITTVGTKNVDFEDVRTALANSGVAIIGNGMAAGKDRALCAAEQALESKLLYDRDIRGAKFILINVTYGNQKITLDEMNEIAMFIYDRAGEDAQIKQGHVFDETLDDKISVSIIAAGFGNGESKVSAYINNRTNNSNAPQMVLEHNLPLSTPSNMVDFQIDFSSSDIEITNQHEPLMSAQPQQLFLDLSADAENNFDAQEQNINVVELPKMELPQAPIELNNVQFEVSNTNQIDIYSTANKAVISAEAALELEKIRKANEERELRKKALKSMNYQFTQHKTSFSEKGMELEQTPHSSENNISEYAFRQNSSGDFELKKNPFLHDNVD